MLLRRLRCQEGLSLTVFGSPLAGTIRGSKEEGCPGQPPPPPLQAEECITSFCFCCSVSDSLSLVQYLSHNLGLTPPPLFRPPPSPPSNTSLPPPPPPLSCNRSVFTLEIATQIRRYVHLRVYAYTCVRVYVYATYTRRIRVCIYVCGRCA